MGEVVDLKKKERWRDPVVFLRHIADQIEKKEIPAVTVGVMTLLFADNGLANYGFGPDAEDLQMVAVSAIGHSLIVADITGA